MSEQQTRNASVSRTRCGTQGDMTGAHDTQFWTPAQGRGTKNGQGSNVFGSAWIED